MKKISGSEEVARMYVDNDSLSTRLGFHDKYSVNGYGFRNWTFDQYEFHDGMAVLELACGTGGIWAGRESRIPGGVKIILSDLSPPMVDKASELLADVPLFSFERIDINNIPHADGSFDAVIANHMLYHVPDINAALSEVNRVLTDDGVFYATTLGKNSLKELRDIYRKLEGRASFSYSEDVSFTLENGASYLQKHFGRIEKREYVDSLRVTDAGDLIDYIMSYNEIPDPVRGELRELVEGGFSDDGIFLYKRSRASSYAGSDDRGVRAGNNRRRSARRNAEPAGKNGIHI